MYNVHREISVMKTEIIVPTLIEIETMVIFEMDIKHKQKCSKLIETEHLQ